MVGLDGRCSMDWIGKLWEVLVGVWVVYGKELVLVGGFYLDYEKLCENLV